jgi:hypothetical protein
MRAQYLTHGRTCGTASAGCSCRSISGVGGESAPPQFLQNIDPDSAGVPHRRQQGVSSSLVGGFKVRVGVIEAYPGSLVWFRRLKRSMYPVAAFVSAADHKTSAVPVAFPEKNQATRCRTLIVGYGGKQSATLRMPIVLPPSSHPVLAAAVRALPFSPALHQRERACEPWRQSPPLRECIPITVKETELKRLSARDWRSVASLGE